MTPEQALDRRLHEIVWRVRLLLAWHWCSRALCAGAAICAAWALASRVTTVNPPSLRILGAILGGSAVMGALAGLLLRITQADAARLVDQRAGERERLATAVEMIRESQAPALAHRQVADAAEHARTLDLRRALPLRWKREMVVLVVAGIVLFALLIAPRMPFFWSAEKKKEVAAVQQQGKLVERVARDAEAVAVKRNLPETRKAAPQVRKLARAMQRGELDKKGAMVHMAKLTKGLADQQKRLAAENASSPKSLAQAGAEAQAMLKREEAERQAKEFNGQSADKLKTAGMNGAKPSDTEAMKLSQEALREFANAMKTEDAAAQNQALRKLADQMESGKLTPAELSRLRNQLKKMANAMKGTPLDKKVAELLRQIANEMARQLKQLTPEQRKKLAEMMRKAAGQCQNCQQCKLDAKQLEQLLKALKEGKLCLSGMCKNGGGLGLKPGPGLGKGSILGTSAAKGGLRGGFGYAANADSGRRIKATAKAPNTKIGGQQGPGVQGGPTISYKGAPDQGERASAAYYQVYAQQKREAEGAVGRETVPAPYRDQVKRYFESVRP
jgi:hypothetical protein